jgi:hypothetical protein
MTLAVNYWEKFQFWLCFCANLCCRSLWLFGTLRGGKRFLEKDFEPRRREGHEDLEKYIAFLRAFRVFVVNFEFSTRNPRDSSLCNE